MKGVGNKRLAIIFLASELRPTDERTGAVGSQRQQTEQETEGKKRVLYHQHRKMGIEVARACTRPRTHTADRDKLGKRENIVSQTMTAAEQTSKASARRTAARRSGKEGVSTGRLRGPPYPYKKTKN